MHSLFEVLLTSFFIASSRVARATQLPDNVDFVPYIKSNYFDTQRDDGKLVSELSEHERGSVGGISFHELFARQAPGAIKADLQTFTGALGGIKAPSITQSTDVKRPFLVEGDTFPVYMEAAMRTCDRQNNACSNMVNALTVGGNAGDADDDDAGDADSDGTEGRDAVPIRQTTATRDTTTSSNSSPSSQAQRQSSTADEGTTTTSRSPTRASSASSSTGTPQSSGNQRLDNGNVNGTRNADNQKRQSKMTLDMCNRQMTQCNTVVRSAAVQSFELVNLGPDPNDPDFDLFCSP